jgi:PAS domain-containing protein
MRSVEAEYEAYFEHAPISIWVEDFSRVAERVDELRAEGVEDFAAYFEGRPDEVMACMGMMRVIEVNAHTLTMYAAASQDELVASLGSVFTPDALPALAASLAALASGERVQNMEAVNRSLVGSTMDVSVQWAVLPGHEKTWSRVLVSILDVSEQKQAERARQKLVGELQQALDEVKTLSGLLPICAACKKIRDDEGFWRRVEEYLQARTDVRFTHGMCPDCADEWFAEHNLPKT